MTPRSVTLPELAMIGGTRAALGAGVALLLGDRLAPDQRRAVGWTLLAVGVISTIPLVAEVIFREPTAPPRRRPPGRWREEARKPAATESNVHRLEDELDHAGLEEETTAESTERPFPVTAEASHIEPKRPEKWGGPQP